MKLNKLIIPFLSFAALLTSCAPEEIGAPYAEVKAEPSYVSIDKDGGSAEVVITATDKWNISGIPEWLTVDPAEGNAGKDIKVTLSALKAYESLSAEIKVNVGGVSQTILVEQSLGKKLAITTVDEFIKNGVDGRTYAIQGVMGKVENDLYGNFYINDGTYTDGDGKGAYVYGMLDAGGAEKNFLSLGIEEGDEIIIQGPRLTYGSKIEMENATLLQIVKKALLGAENTSFVVECDTDSLYVPVSVKGDDLTAGKPSADWLHFTGVEGTGEDSEIILTFDENTTTAAREATITLGSFKAADPEDEKSEDIESELTITVKQMPGFPVAKKAAEIDYEKSEYVTVDGQIVALTTNGFVLNDGSANEVNRVYVDAEDLGFDFSDYTVGDMVKAVGSANKDYAKNSIIADYVKVTKEAEGEFEQPKAVVLDKDNMAAVYAESPAKYGYYKTTGYVSSAKSIVVSGAKQTITAIDATNDLSLKSFEGKFIAAYGYVVTTNTKESKIQMVLTEVEELEDAPEFFELPMSAPKDPLKWNETSIDFEVLASPKQKWTAAITEGVEGVLISHKEGEGIDEITISFPGANNTYEEQKVVVTVTSGNQSHTYTVTREAMVLKLETDKPVITKQAAEIIVKIEATKFWKISIDNEDATLDKTEGMGTDAVVVKIPKNNTGENVLYTLTLTEDRVTGTPKSTKLTITQMPIEGVDTEGEGTEESPYTPQDVIKMYAEKVHDSAKDVYVGGIISSIADYSLSYGNASYYISADGTDKGALYIFRGKWFGGAKFTEEGQIKVGDKIVIKGKISDYEGVVQMAQNNEIVDIEVAEVKFDVDPKTVSLDKGAGTFSVNMLCKYDEFEVKPSADWITLKGMTSKGNDYVVSFSYTANEKGAREAKVDFIANGETISVPVIQAGAILEKTAAEINAAEDGATIYRITGYISRDTGSEYGNIYIKDYSGEVYVYGVLNAEGESKKWKEMGIKAGDIVTVEGPKVSYKGDPQLKNVTVTKHIPVAAVTVADFKPKADSKEVWYSLTGTVKNIVMDKNEPSKPSVYGNFDIEDATGSVYVYGLVNGWGGASKQFREMNIKEGDKVTIVGVHGSHNNAAQVGSAFLVSHEEGSTGGGNEGGEVTPPVEEGDSKVLAFDFTSSIEGWPNKAAGQAAGGTYVYALDGINYSFDLSINAYMNTGYLMVSKKASVGLPKIEGYKLTKIVGRLNKGASVKSKVSVTADAAGATAVAGGEAQVWNQVYVETQTEYTYNLTGTAANTMYYMYVDNSANSQWTKLELTYTKE